MNSVVETSSAEAIAGLLDLVCAADPVVDVTYGNGTFWKGSSRKVLGGDVDAARAKDFTADFRALPFRDASVATVIYDPPFHPYVNSAEQVRFKGMGNNEKQMRSAFDDGLRECWRITKDYLVVKCQGFVHNHAPQWMPLWAVAICGEPFEWLIVTRGHKRISGRWEKTLSLRRNHADYLLFSKRGNKR